LLLFVTILIPTAASPHQCPPAPSRDSSPGPHRVLAGPYCSMILGDMGADVIKVERPGGGDETRQWGPPFAAEDSVYFLMSAWTSASRPGRPGPPAVPALRRPAGELRARQAGEARAGLCLAERLESRPHLLQHLRLRPVRAVAPAGRLRRRAAAIGGFLGITGEPDGPPVRAGVAVTDLSTGLYALSAILAALYRRRTAESLGEVGRGCWIDANLLDTQVATMSHVAASFLHTGQEPSRWGTGHANLAPYQAFDTSDRRQLILGAGNDRQFGVLCRRLGAPHLATDPRFLSNRLRVANRTSLIPLIQALVRARPLADWLAALEGSDLPYGRPPVADPASGLLVTCEHPAAGRVTAPGPAVRFDGRAVK
uniref:CoA transferase n=1 Tax=Macrostomum lignano TaxID=282301 RepID=A0A1I8FD58_9PLAT